MRRVRVRSFVLMVVLALVGTGTAEASAVCTQLKAQLASASRNSGSSANFQRFATAVQKQAGQISQVQTDLKRFGCTSGSIIVLGGQNAKACSKLTSAHKKMRVNLAALERKRDSFARRIDKVATRRIQAALKANDCDGKRAAVVEAALKGSKDAVRAKKAKSPGLVAILGDSGGKCAFPRTSTCRNQISWSNRRPRGAAATAPCACAHVTGFSSRSLESQSVGFRPRRTYLPDDVPGNRDRAVFSFGARSGK